MIGSIIILEEYISDEGYRMDKMFIYFCYLLSIIKTLKPNLNTDIFYRTNMTNDVLIFIGSKQSFAYLSVYNIHATSFLFEFESAEKVTIYYNNSGMGADYHGINDNSIPSTFKFDNVSLNKVRDLIVMLDTFKTHDLNQYTHQSDYYLAIFSIITGYSVVDLQLIDFAQSVYKYPLQTTGDCSFKSFFLLLMPQAQTANGLGNLYDLYLDLQHHYINKYKGYGISFLFCYERKTCISKYGR